MVTRMVKRAAVAMGLGVAALGLATEPAAAEDAFAKITGSVQGVILGDQTNIPALPGSKDAVQVFSTDFGVSVQLITSGSGAGAGIKPSVTPVAVVKHFDRASPKLLRAAFTGETLTVEITWFMVFQGTPRKTVTVKLDGALITDMRASADLQGTVASGFESVSFTYSRITFSTPIIDPATGQVTGTSSVCLDAVSTKTC